MARSPKHCIYCSAELLDDVPRAHLFPQYMGGHMWIDQVCRACNNAIGTAIEGRAKESLIVASALNSLDIQKPIRAFDHIQFVDAEDGQQLKLTLRGLSVARHAEPGEKWVGELGFVLDGLRRFVRENRPNWVAHVEKEIERGATVIKVPGKTYEISRKRPLEPMAVGKQDFSKSLVAKVVYEAMVALDFPNSRLIRQFRGDFFNVDPNVTGAGRVRVHLDRLSKVCETFHIMDENGLPKNPLLRTYKPFHRLDMRITDNGVVYCKVWFFAAIAFLVVIGRIGEEEEYCADARDCFLVFPVNPQSSDERLIDGGRENVRPDELERANAIADELAERNTL